MVHMVQMNRPQSAHGYPSDARSSFPHDLQIIASRSRNSAISSSLVRAVSGRAG